MYIVQATNSNNSNQSYDRARVFAASAWFSFHLPFSAFSFFIFALCLSSNSHLSFSTFHFIFLILVVVVVARSFVYSFVRSLSVPHQSISRPLSLIQFQHILLPRFIVFLTVKHSTRVPLMMATAYTHAICMYSQTHRHTHTRVHQRNECN